MSERVDEIVRQNFKRCDCHITADRHRFGKHLECQRKGCEVNWFQHQQRHDRCEGGRVPPAVLGSRFDA